MPKEYTHLTQLVQTTDLFSEEKRQEILSKIPDLMPETVNNIIEDIEHYESEKKRIEDNEHKEEAQKQTLYAEQYAKVMVHIHEEELKEWKTFGEKELHKIEKELGEG